EADRAPRQAAFVPPATDLERAVADVFGQTLEVERVGAADGFFDLGGHSLLAARATYQLSERLGVELPLRAIFEHPTPAKLARAIEAIVPARAGADDRIPRVEREPEGGWPLSVAQRRIWLLDELDPGNPGYNVRLAVRLDGEVDVDLLRRGLHEVVRRQAAMRTTIVRAGDGAAQMVRAPAPVPMPVVDLAGAGEAEVRRRVREQAARPFDLARGPLLRASLLRLGATEHVLALAFHHSVVDEWSTGILMRELTEAYEALRTGRPPRLPALPIRYVDFAVWQERWLARPRLERLLAHWTGLLRDAPFELRLPVDRPRPAVPSTDGGRLTTMLPRPLTDALGELARREGGTTFMVLLGAFLLLLEAVTGQDDLVVGSPIANRNRPEIEPLIGFFANILLLRVRLAGDPTFRELLARVRAVAVDAYAHQDVPFERLVEALRPARVRHRTPLVQVWFVLHNAPMPDLQLPGLRLTLLPTGSETAKFDLNFALTDVGGDLRLAVEYSTDLFEEATARRLLDGYRALLAHVVRHPEHRSSEVRAAVPLQPTGDRQMTTEQHDRSRPGRMGGLRSARPTPVRVSRESLARSRPLRDDGPLPLLVEPAAGQLDLAAWIAAEREWVSERLLEHGGILFRGFGVDGVEAFERVIQAYSADLLDYYERSTPRQHVGGRVYTSTEYPPERHIPLHCESAYSYYWPLKLWFHCIVPAAEGGATPVCDSRRVLELIDPAVRRRFEERRVMYVRNYHEGFDIPWQVAFQTDDPDVVAEYCRRVGME
ncbi:MAG TPA: condensation domain-containing protein, partial [Candidatus Eisenbacteria bacterium]|nr:condensation domain-containing protein [Candidatus Eisenbacteria bacterium]